MPIYFDDDQLSMRLIWGSNTDPLYVFRNGGISDSDSYIRLNTAYASDPLGTVIEVPRDVPPYEHVDGEKRFLQYEGENQNAWSNDFENWTGAAIGGDNEIVFNDISDTASINTTDFGFTADDFTKKETFNITNTDDVYDYCYTSEGINVCVSFVASSDTITSFSVAAYPRSSGFISLIIETPNVYDADRLNIKNLQVTNSSYVLPFIPTAGTAVTVNKGTTSLLSEDIEEACYNFTNAGNETLNTGLLTQVLTSVDFNIRLRTTNGDALTMCPLDTGDYMIAVASGAGYVINFSHDGTDYINDTELAFNTSYLIELTDAGVLSINGTPDTLSAGTSNPVVSTDILFGSAGASLHIDGYAWGINYYNSSGLLANYKCAEYRQDVFSPDSSGNGNHGTIVNATLADFRVENQGFGYPVNEPARKPWSYTTDDGVVVPFGLREFFGGKADGSLENSGSLAAINRYKVITTETDHFGAGVVAGDIVTGLTTALDANNTVRQVSPAVGTIPFTSYIPHGLTEDMPLIKFQESDFVPLYVEAATGLIKSYDGTNTGVSASATVAGTEVSGWLSFNGDSSEMWITLDGTKGTITTFIGYFPEVGNRVFGVTNGTYQTIMTLGFENKLAFEYWTDTITGERWFDEITGEYWKEYL